MNIRGREEYMNPWPDRRLQRLRRTFNIVTRGPGQSGNNRTRDRCRDSLHRREVSVRSDGETSLDDVNAKLIQLPPQAYFLLYVHAATWRLLSIAQSRVKDSDSRAFHCALHLLNYSDLTGGDFESKAYNFAPYRIVANVSSYTYTNYNNINIKTLWIFFSLRSSFPSLGRPAFP